MDAASTTIFANAVVAAEKVGQIEGPVGRTTAVAVCDAAKIRPKRRLCAIGQDAVFAVFFPTFRATDVVV